MIKFSVVTNNTIPFKVQQNKISFTTEVGRIVYLDMPWYEGDYTVTPTFEDQVLETKQHAMSNDLTVEEIPLFEVSNETGTTLIIGG